MSHFSFEHIREDTIEGVLILVNIFDLEQIYLAFLIPLPLRYIVKYFLSL